MNLSSRIRSPITCSPETRMYQSTKEDTIEGRSNPAYNKNGEFPNVDFDSAESGFSSFVNDVDDASNSYDTQIKGVGRRQVVPETTLLMPGSVSETKKSRQRHSTQNGYGTVCSGEVGESTLSVFHVNYTVQQWVGPWWHGACFRQVRKKCVLNDISMVMKSGEVTAVLGNSGSGKTSLLDVITCRSKGEVTGDVMYNNSKCTRDVIQQHAAYVMQADRLLPNLTVRETLRYTARLKLPGGTSNRDIEYKVTSVIMEMGLKDVADSRVGNSLIRGISGGEQRRVTIAIQLLKDPDLILLDEPTTGLDSYTARYLVSNLRDLARRGKIVLLTIHQPSSDIFQFFDQIALMSVGEMVYCGPAKSMVPYFTHHGYPCDRYTNPLDRYVDVASVDRRDADRERESLERVGKLVEAFRFSVLQQTTVQSLLERSQKYSDLTPPREKKLKGPSYIRVMTTILSRINKNLFRDRKDYMARIFLLPFFIIFILLFLGRLKDNQQSIQDRIGLLYQSATVPPFMGIVNSVALYPCLRDLFYRETVDGLYGTATFLLAYSIHVIPFHAISSIIFSSVVYWVCGLQPDADKFLYYTLAVFILHYWGEILTVTLMGIFMNPNMAQSNAALLQAATVLIGSGLLKNVQSLVKPLQWVSWILMHRYSVEIFIANEFNDLTFNDCPENVTEPCFSSGNQYIDRYFPDSTEHMTRNFGAMGAYVLCSLIIAILVYKLIGPKTLH